METKYTVNPYPHKAMPKDIIDFYQSLKINLMNSIAAATRFNSTNGPAVATSLILR